VIPSLAQDTRLKIKAVVPKLSLALAMKRYKWKNIHLIGERLAMHMGKY